MVGWYNNKWFQILFQYIFSSNKLVIRFSSLNILLFYATMNIQLFVQENWSTIITW